MTAPAAPKGTGPGGRRLWRAVLADFDLEDAEVVLLGEAVRTVDTLDRLAAVVASAGDVIEGKEGPRVHPALVEARQLRIVLARLNAALRLPDDPAASDGRTPRNPQRRTGSRGVYAIRGTRGTA